MIKKLTNAALTAATLILNTSAAQYLTKGAYKMAHIRPVIPNVFMSRVCHCYKGRPAAFAGVRRALFRKKWRHILVLSRFINQMFDKWG